MSVGAVLFIIALGCIVMSDLFVGLMFELLVLVGYLFRFLFACLWEVLKLARSGTGAVVPPAWLGFQRLCTWGWRGFALAFEFLALLIEEWRAGPPEGQEIPREEPPATQQPDPYGQALALLGLVPGFTQDVLKHSYRRAMRTAHPDNGGSTAAAQAVNGAYALVLSRHGWPR